MVTFGGPDFLPVNGKPILMAIDSVGGDHVCRATSGNYRLDTATAMTFSRILSRYRKQFYRLAGWPST